MWDAVNPTRTPLKCDLRIREPARQLEGHVCTPLRPVF